MVSHTGSPRDNFFEAVKMYPMPHRIRFCRNCMETRQTLSRETCQTCGGELLPWLDGAGAICREFLLARGNCCDSGCRNCPYSNGAASVIKAETKNCPRCKERFECRSDGCWCAQVRLSAAMLKWLDRTFDDCLCPACLSQYAVG